MSPKAAHSKKSKPSKSTSKKSPPKAPAKAKSKVQSKAAPKSSKASPKAAQVSSKPEVLAEKIAGVKKKLTQESSTKDLAKAASQLRAAPGPVVPLLDTSAADIAAGRCREAGCELDATAEGYCRTHYIRNWRKIKRKEVILKEGKLNQYIEELVNKYPEKYIEAIRQDLALDRDFSKVVQDLELNISVEDEDVESESIDSLLDNIRKDLDVDVGGGGGGGGGSSGIEEDEDLF